MPTILLSDEFDTWLSALRDSRAKARIAARIRSMSLGNFGDAAPVGGAVSELRIHYGPGYRLYYTPPWRNGLSASCRRGQIEPEAGHPEGHDHGGKLSGTEAMIKFGEFDASKYLTDEDAIAEYLAAALEDGDPNVFVAALGDVAKARGMTQIARDAGLGRESLYKALAPGSKLRYETVRKIMGALGVKLTVSA